MKVLSLFAIAITFACFFSVSTGISSCTKTDTVYDTTYITVHDTTTVKDSVYDLTSGLVAYFSFKDGSLADGSGYGNNIIFNSATKTTDRFGNPNNAYLFDGSSNYMRVKNSYSVNPDNITLYAIVNVNGFYTGACSGNVIFAKGSPDDITGFYELLFTDFSVDCGTPNLNNETFGGAFGDNIPKGAGAGAASVTPINKGHWYHVAFTYDGLVAKMYIDGQLASSAPKVVNSTDNTHDIFIGKNESATYPYYFNGAIDEIRIYNRALTGDAILHLVNSGD